MLKDLAAAIATNSYDYDSHLARIQLLRRAARSEIDANGEPNPEILAELRTARQDMDNRFPVGEDLWIDWIADEVSFTNFVTMHVQQINLTNV